MTNEIEEIKNFQKVIFDSLNRVEQASLDLSQINFVLEDICHQVQSELGFDFAGISLISPQQDKVEAAYGTGIAKKWSGRIKHYLEKEPSLRDIQADIVDTHNTEIISGWDERFDPWVYKQYNHNKIIRVFTPIIIIQDDNGSIINNWVDCCEWEVLSIEKNEGQHIVCKIQLPDELNKNNVWITVIGTIEAGYDDYLRSIDIDKVKNLVKIIASRSQDIWKSQLPHFLNTIAESSMKILKADASSLNFLYDLDLQRYTYEVFSGRLQRHFLRKCPPRPNGLGRISLSAGKYRFIPDKSKGHSPDELSRSNRDVFNEGVRAMAAFPLIINYQKELKQKKSLDKKISSDQKRREGVLYVEHHKDHFFTEDELRWGELFANRAIAAIQNATAYEDLKNKEQQMTAVHSIAQSFSLIEDRSQLLPHIAWNTLNVLAADIVTIYEYVETENQFHIPPEVAGRLKTQQTHKDIIRHNVPHKIVTSGENIYVEDLQSKPGVFADSLFAKRQDIKSVAGILLKVKKSVVGVMFINYRRIHRFSVNEKQIIETLASAAATAIQDKRYLATLNDIDHEIATTLDGEKLLKLIIQSAVKITGASVGSILFVDPISQELTIKTRHPENILFNLGLDRLKMGEGIAGWVADKKEVYLDNNIQASQLYIAYYENMNSKLCVPILDRNNKTIGVLDVESERIDAFNLRDKDVLESLSAQAVIAIQSTEDREQLIKARTMATLGDLSFPLVHKMNNEIGAIRGWAQILIKNDPRINRIATKIIDRTDIILQGVKRLRSWMEQKPELITLHDIADDAFSQVNISPSINCKNNIPANASTVFAGKQQLTDVLDNLIQNAANAMPTGGELSINSSNIEVNSKNWILVCVRDTGIGIPAEKHEIIFEANYGSSENKRGMGYGLWWTKAYIESLGGNISVESVLGRGSTFILKLPTYQAND
jgi:signal transduction histidine kinase